MANRYWVGGTDSWNGTAASKWATTSGGAGGASVPTSSDNVFFDGSSGAGTVTIATATANCADLDFTGFTGTWAGSTAINIFGSLTLAAGMTRTYTGLITFAATATGKTVTLNDKTLASAIDFNGVGGGWTLQDTFNDGSSNFFLTRGSLDLNGKTVTCGTFSGTGSNTRSLTMGAATVNCTDVDFVTTTNLTFNAGTSQINYTGTSNNTMDFGGLTWYNVSLAPTDATNLHTLTGANTFNDLTYTGSANKSETFYLAADQTVNGTLTVNGNSTTNRVWFGSNTLGTARTVTAANTSFSNCDLSDITAAGAGAWTGTSFGDAGGNTGITFTTPVTRYWVGGTGNYSSTGEWSTSSGGGTGASVPLCHDTVVFDSNSFTAANTITLDMQRYPTLDFSGATNTPNVTYGSPTRGMFMLGGLILTATGTVTAQPLTYIGRSTFNITSNSKTSATTVAFEAPGGAYTSTDAFVASSTWKLTAGGYTANSDVTATTFTISGTTTRSLTMGSGIWTATSTGAAWSAATVTGLTFSGASATIKFTNSSASSKTFAGGGLTYGTFWVATGSTGTTTISGSNTFSVLKSDVGRAIILTASTTQTLTTASGAQFSGSAGDLVTITSTSSTNASISVASGTVSVDYVSLTDNTATGGASFYAGANSTNGGDNPGWTFTAPPATSSKSTSMLMGV